jgi:hypothetical protein
MIFRLISSNDSIPYVLQYNVVKKRRKKTVVKIFYCHPIIFNRLFRAGLYSLSYLAKHSAQSLSQSHSPCAHRVFVGAAMNGSKNIITVYLMTRQSLLLFCFRNKRNNMFPVHYIMFSALYHI